MANKTEKNTFKPGLYAVVAGIAVAVVLVLIVIFAFTTRYTAFKPEKVAQTYVDTIVQTGDGYNAYKNTLVSKNSKYGDFIYNAYMRPYVNDGDDVKQADFVGKGNAEEQEAIDNVYTTMYDYYVQLVDQYGLDDYDDIFSLYFAKLPEVRKQYYGDEYMDRDYMFGAFESNVSSYGLTLTGQDAKEADEGTAAQEKIVGEYEKVYGDDYKLTSTVTACETLSDADAKAYIAEYKERIAPVVALGEERAETFNISEDNKESFVSAYTSLDQSENIDAVAKCTVEVTESDKVVATQEVYVVKIGHSWYVDNTNVDTSSLYNFYK